MKIISPIAIDMGAKNTGVYYAKYERGSSFEKIDNKRGEVLVYDDYTPLLKDRTAKRHARRGYQRRKLAKRLLTLVLENYFDFPAKKHAQALGFLLNRRGFTFLDETYSKEHLANFPADAWENLPASVRNAFECKENIAANLQKFSEAADGKIHRIFQAVESKNKDVRADLVYFAYIGKIGRACEDRVNGNPVNEKSKGPNKLSRTAVWIVARLNEKQAIFAVGNGRNVDLLKQINDLIPAQAKSLRERLPDIQAGEKRAKESAWNFKISEFPLNAKNEQALSSADANAHLHHLSHAIHQLNAELTSGARHRTKYFDEIERDLEAFSREAYVNNAHNPNYIKNFACAVNASENLNMNKLHRVLCHISNLELKPLRAYFNDNAPVLRKKDLPNGVQSQSNFVSHAAKNGGDVFSSEKLSRIASTWFLKNWVVSAEKDDKSKVSSYRDLKTRWNEHGEKGDLVAFWAKTDPVLTVPPYQSMTNRRPPICQSLVLNPAYLNEHYPHWNTWLDQLQPDPDYRKKLQSLQSGKGKRKNRDGKLIRGDLLCARQLQFVLDASKKTDRYSLNDIWSIHHKLQNLQAGDDEAVWNERMRAARDASELPCDLKNDLQNHSPGGFGHFINKYYQTRKRAKEGRYFLHQQRKNQWETAGKLFAMCAHRPKQKKHQWQLDLAAIVGADSDDMVRKIGKQTPEKWLLEIKGFKGACGDAATMQKKHRGALKIKIGYAKKQALLKKNLAQEDSQLVKLAGKCEYLAVRLAQVLHPAAAPEKQQANAEKFGNVFGFAQINNIVFQDRKGFSKTCPVCSVDNAFRMREIEKGGQGVARASRLPAMSIRLIDGLVMRICDAVSRHVAAVCWERIKDDLHNGSRVTIPLVLEQNRFEFEPNLRKLKGKPSTESDSDQADSLDPGDIQSTKERRIVDAASGVCAYTGADLAGRREIDHIIPRASKHGVLNDEANLICVSALGNQGKDKQTKFLDDLSKRYKEKIFPGMSDEEIKGFLYEQLEGERASEADADVPFVFGPYLSFINLDEKQQVAFRHALFLRDDDKLKQKVINALQNRNRAIVNGTQRYMAQCVADKIKKLADKAGRASQIEFDYFEYPAARVQELRRFFAEYQRGIAKTKAQNLHSHLIDAQMAFLLAVQNHQDEGGMALKLSDLETIWEEAIDPATGEISPKYCALSYIDEEQFAKKNLRAKTSNKKIADIVTAGKRGPVNLSKVFSRYVFKGNAIGERYQPIAEYDGELYRGYPQKTKGGKYECAQYCTKIAKSQIKRFRHVVESGKYYALTTDNEQIKIWTIKMVGKKYKQIDKDSHKYFSREYQAQSAQEKDEIAQIKLIIGVCRYYVARTDVRCAPHVIKTAQRNPVLARWIAFDEAWKREAGGDYAVEEKQNKLQYKFAGAEVREKWDRFCARQQFPVLRAETAYKTSHAKTSRKFTMVAATSPSGTVFRVNRGGKDIYQAVPLDSNVVAKDRSNFLIQHSKNLALVSKDADEILKRPINTVDERELDDEPVKAALFFKSEFLGERESDVVRVFLSNTAAEIKNFPLEKFLHYCRYHDAEKLTAEQKRGILGKTSMRFRGADNADDVYADKSTVDDSIELTTRDGGIKGIKIDGTTVNFSLPFKSDAVRRFLESIADDA